MLADLWCWYSWLTFGVYSVGWPLVFIVLVDLWGWYAWLTFGVNSFGWPLVLIVTFSICIVGLPLMLTVLVDLQCLYCWLTIGTYSVGWPWRCVVLVDFWLLCALCCRIQKRQRVVDILLQVMVESIGFSVSLFEHLKPCTVWDILSSFRNKEIYSHSIIISNW